MFEPIYPAHAVENASIMLVFSEPVPQKLFSKLRDLSSKKFTALRFLRQENPGFELDGSTGRVVSIPPNQLPIHFVGIDNGQTVLFAPDNITIFTSSYVRWTPFLEQSTSYLDSCFGELLDVVSISTIKLEYVDRFFWSGGWDTIDFKNLLKQDGFRIPEAFLGHERQWHNHSGWFTQNNEPIRRLYNVNVDAVDAMRPSRPTPLPSVSIRTSVQDQVNTLVAKGSPPWESSRLLAEQLEILHLELKTLLATLITDEMQNKIRLFEEKK